MPCSTRANRDRLKWTILAVALAFLGGCGGTAVINDLEEDKVVVQGAGFPTPEQIRAEAAHGCEIHGRVPVEISFTCKDQYCTIKNYLFACKKKDVEPTRSINSGPSSRPWFGMRVEDSGKMRASGSGVVISRIDPNGPAEKAGLQVGDVITFFNGVAIQNAAMLADLAKGFVGAGAPISIRRGDKNQYLFLPVGASDERL